MAKAEQWRGFGQRVRQRMRALGYVRADGSEDISRFTLENRYVVTLFYKYLTNTTPSRENLLRLAKDLEVSPGWLLFGDDRPRRTQTRKRPRRPVPIAGGSGQAQPLPDGSEPNHLSLIGHRLMAWFGWLARPMLLPA